jgi:hypothetical protein
VPEVIIRHPKTGKEYGIRLADFRRRKTFAEDDGTVQTYEEAGFRIVSYADGSPYEQPKAD